MKHSKSIPYSMIRHALLGAQHHNIDYQSLLFKAGIDGESLLSTDGRLSLKKHAELVRELWLTMGDECAGALCRPVPNGSFAMMTHAVLSSDSLREAMHRCIHFFSLVAEGMALELTEQGDEARLSLRFDNPHQINPCYFIVSWFVILIRFSSWLVNRPVLLDRVTFEFSPPEYVAEFPTMFPCLIYFDHAENSVIFNRAVLDNEIMQDNTSLKTFLAGAPECLLAQFRSDDSLSGQIKLLLQEETESALGFREVAEKLNATTYTLRRRLKKEGASFQQIKASFNRNKAQHLLVHTHLAIAEIAANVGYSEPAAFNHAFRGWTGMSPGKYRQQFAGKNTH